MDLVVLQSGQYQHLPSEPACLRGLSRIGMPLHLYYIYRQLFKFFTFIKNIYIYTLAFINPFPAMTGGFNQEESEAYKNIFYI